MISNDGVFLVELAQIQAESIGWTPLEEGVPARQRCQRDRGAGGGCARGGGDGVTGGVRNKVWLLQSSNGNHYEHR